MAFSVLSDIPVTVAKGVAGARNAAFVRKIARAVLIAALVGVTGAPAGCGGKEVTGPPDVTAAEFLPATAEAMCGNIGPCCAAQNLAFDDAHCRETVTESFNAWGNWSRLQGPIAGSRKCLDSLAETTRSCTSGVGCNEALASLEADRKGAGEPCDSTCTPIADIGITCDEVAGQLDRAPSSSARQACFTSDGLYCEGASSTCKARIAPGGPCDESESYACSSDRCLNGSCASGGFEGASCLLFGGGHCATGLYCASSSGHCESYPGRQKEPCRCAKQKLDGEACNEVRECAWGNCEDGKCTRRSPLTTKQLTLFCH
jgi:hypothetical protein